MIKTKIELLGLEYLLFEYGLLYTAIFGLIVSCIGTMLGVMLFLYYFKTVQEFEPEDILGSRNLIIDPLKIEPNYNDESQQEKGNILNYEEPKTPTSSDLMGDKEE